MDEHLLLSLPPHSDHVGSFQYFSNAGTHNLLFGFSHLTEDPFLPPLLLIGGSKGQGARACGGFPSSLMHQAVGGGQEHTVLPIC